MSLVLSELPKAETVEQIEALLPWNLDTDAVATLFAELPAP